MNLCLSRFLYKETWDESQYRSTLGSLISHHVNYNELKQFNLDGTRVCRNEIYINFPANRNFIIRFYRQLENKFKFVAIGFFVLHRQNTASTEYLWLVSSNRNCNSHFGMTEYKKFLIKLIYLELISQLYWAFQTQITIIRMRWIKMFIQNKILTIGNWIDSYRIYSGK